MSNISNTLLPRNLALYDTNSYGGIVSRKSGYTAAQPTNGYIPGNKIMFTLPLEFIDFRKSTFQFTIAGIAGTGGTYTRFNVDMRSIIDRMQIICGSTVIYDCQGQNLLFNMMNNIKDVNWAATAGTILNGTGTTAQRQTDFANPNRVYAVELYNIAGSDLLSYALPMQKLGAQTQIVLYLAQPASCMESDGANPSYVVNNCQYHYDSLTPSPGWDNLYNSRVMSNGVNFNYLNYEFLFDSSTLQVGLRRATKSLTFRYSSLIGVIAVMRPIANVESLTANNKLSTYNFNGIDSAQMRIGTYTQPIDQVRSYSDLYMMFLQLFDKSAQEALAGAVNFNTNNFILAINLARHPYEKIDQNTSISGINTSISNNLQLDISFDTPLNVAYTLETYGLYESTVSFNANGSITFQQ